MQQIQDLLNNLRIMTVWDCRVDMLELKRDMVFENLNIIEL
jgi:hypothetical protein